MNDHLARRLRAAKPGTVRRGDPLSARGEREWLAYREREETVALTPVSSRRRRSLRGLRGGAVAAVTVLVVVASINQQVPATAHTPPVLHYTPVSASARELLTSMADRALREEPEAAVIRAQTWSLDTEIDADGSIVSTSLEPQWRETWFRPDGTVRFRLTAAEPFVGQDPADLPEPGTVLVDEVYAPGSDDSAFPEPPPEQAADVGRYLMRASGADALTAGAAIDDISAMLSTIVVTAAQESALLSFLGTLPGLTVLGAVTDRLGRQGIAFQASDRDPDATRDILIVSPATGRILAAETVFVGDGRADIGSPSVLDYVAWVR